MIGLMIWVYSIYEGSVKIFNFQIFAIFKISKFLYLGTSWCQCKTSKIYENVCPTQRDGRDAEIKRECV